MKEQRIFSSSTGVKVVTELESLPDTLRYDIAAYVIQMREKSASQVVCDIQRAKFNHLSYQALNYAVFQMISYKSSTSSSCTTSQPCVNFTPAEREGTKYVGGALIRSMLKAKSLNKLKQLVSGFSREMTHLGQVYKIVELSYM